MKTFSKAELKQYNGCNGPTYIAYAGKVYDVSSSFLWKKGIHQCSHEAGQDLTPDLDQAPHGPDLMDKFPVIGVLE
ncbi:MAG: cytochrome B5 [Chloroflexi bacterium]|nr:cytochrome B5 [Chloroflexota bacterium]